MTRILAWLLAALIASCTLTPASFAQPTPRLQFPSTGNAAMDGAFRTLDRYTVPIMGSLIFCGDLVNNTTTYLGPPAQGGANEMAGTACSAADSTTEATADNAPYGSTFAPTLLGMHCRATSAGSNGVVFQLRQATANVTGVTCTIPTGATSCDWWMSSAPFKQLDAGAVLAVRAITTEDLSSADAWCELFWTLPF